MNKRDTVEVKNIEARIGTIEKREVIIHNKILEQMGKNDIERVQPLINLYNVYQEGIRDLMNMRSSYWKTNVTIGFKDE